MKNNIDEINGWLYHRIRMCIWKQWKLSRTKRRNLIKMGVHEYYANMAANCRRGHWYCANLTTVKKAMTKERLTNSGFYDLATAYQSVHVNYWNRRVPNGTHGGVRGRRLVTASYSIFISYSSLVPFCKQISCSHENLLTKRYEGSATLWAKMSCEAAESVEDREYPKVCVNLQTDVR